MPDTAWEEYCEASLDLSNQDDVGDPVITQPLALRRLPLQLNLPYNPTDHG